MSEARGLALTDRELTVLQAFADGDNQIQAGAKIHRERGAVRATFLSIQEKFGFTPRYAHDVYSCALAYRLGLIVPDPRYRLRMAPLTRRSRMVVGAVARGYSVPEIAEQMDVAMYTVKSQLYKGKERVRGLRMPTASFVVACLEQRLLNRLDVPLPSWMHRGWRASELGRQCGSLPLPGTYATVLGAGSSWDLASDATLLRKVEGMNDLLRITTGTHVVIGSPLQSYPATVTGWSRGRDTFRVRNPDTGTITTIRHTRVTHMAIPRTTGAP